jgi:two-component system NarL family response regulator
VRPLRLYIIDGNAAFVRAVCTFLGSYETVKVVGTADTWQEALAKAPALRPDVIMLDLDPVDLSGLELVPNVQSILPQAVVIVWTLYEMAAYRSAVQNAGVDGYLTKDRIADDLMIVIEEAIQKSRYLGVRTIGSAMNPDNGSKSAQHENK